MQKTSSENRQSQDGKGVSEYETKEEIDKFIYLKSTYFICQKVHEPNLKVNAKRGSSCKTNKKMKGYGLNVYIGRQNNLAKKQCS